MDIVKRILSVFLIATAVAVALNLILTPVYHDGSPEYPIWKILNWFMAAGVLVALVVNYIRKRMLGGGGAEGQPDIFKYVGVNAAYYGAIVLTMLFFWEWFWTPEPRQRDRRCRDLAHGLLPHSGRPLHMRRLHDRRQPLEQHPGGRLRWRVPGTDTEG